MLECTPYNGMRGERVSAGVRAVSPSPRRCQAPLCLYREERKGEVEAGAGYAVSLAIQQEAVPSSRHRIGRCGRHAPPELKARGVDVDHVIEGSWQSIRTATPADTAATEGTGRGFYPNRVRRGRQDSRIFGEDCSFLRRFAAPRPAQRERKLPLSEPRHINCSWIHRTQFTRLCGSPSETRRR